MKKTTDGQSPEDDDPGSSSLKAVLEQVLDLQAQWSATNTDAMQERGRLVREVGPTVLRGVIRETGADRLGTEGSNGRGNISRVPWMRVFGPEHSPSATDGWYLVYLFGVDGSKVYLSLNQGTTESIRVPSGQWLKSRPRDEIATRAADARALLKKEGDDPGKYLFDIVLRDPGPLGRGYESGNVLARQYEGGDLPDEAELRRDLLDMLPLLDKLYAETKLSDPSAWDEFIAWARRFHEWDGFDADERDYKIEAAESIREALEAMADGAENWVDLLKRSFQEAHLTSWRTDSRFIEWIQENQQVAIEILETMWPSDDPERGTEGVP